MTIVRSKKTPGPDHPITVEPGRAALRVTVGGLVIAESSRALVLREAGYPPVYYIPREDTDMAQLVRSDHETYCPYKGDCNYFSIPAGGDKALNAVWTYEHPFDAVSSIRDHLAFYPDRVDSIVVA